MPAFLTEKMGNMAYGYRIRRLFLLAFCGLIIFMGSGCGKTSDSVYIDIRQENIDDLKNNVKTPGISLKSEKSQRRKPGVFLNIFIDA